MKLQLTYTHSAKEAQKYFKHMTREINKRVANKWRTEFFPLRFTEQATARYNFSPRTKKYNERKGNTKNLVFSGKSKEFFMTQFTERSTFKQHTIKWSNIPKQFSFTGRIRPIDNIDLFIINHPSNRAREIAIDLQKKFNLKPNEISYRYIYRVKQGMGRVLQKGGRKMPNIYKELGAINSSEIKELRDYAEEQYNLLINESDKEKKTRYRRQSVSNGLARTKIK